MAPGRGLASWAIAAAVAAAQLGQIAIADEAAPTSDGDASKKPGAVTISLEDTKVKVDLTPHPVEVQGVLLKADVKDVGLLKMVAIRQKGGIIQSCSLDDMPSVIFNNPRPDKLDGSTFWPSPQDSWGNWPPPPDIEPLTTDKDPLGPKEDWYDMTYFGNEVVLTSKQNDTFHFKVSKSIYGELSKGGFVVDYKIYNTGKAPMKKAGWQVNRVRPGGLTFFPTGKKEDCGPWKCLKLEYEGGATWFQHTGKEKQGKLYTSTAKPPEGANNTWLAHTDGKSVLVNCWEWVCEDCHAPGEGSVEIYDGVDYVEVEAQGPYSPVEPGGKTPLRWKVVWYVRPVPEGSKAEIGDKGLLALANDLCM